MSRTAQTRLTDGATAANAKKALDAGSVDLCFAKRLSSKAMYNSQELPDYESFASGLCNCILNLMTVNPNLAQLRGICTSDAECDDAEQNVADDQDANDLAQSRPLPGISLLVDHVVSVLR